MGRMSDIHMEIVDAVNQGELTFDQITQTYGVPLSWVIEFAKHVEQISVDNQFSSIV
jgi:hypothetical protein